MISSRTKKVKSRAHQTFRLAAQSLSRSNNSALGSFYRRMRAKHGGLKANVAAAHKLARIVYFMLKMTPVLIIMSSNIVNGPSRISGVKPKLWGWPWLKPVRPSESRFSIDPYSEVSSPIDGIDSPCLELSDFWPYSAKTP